MVQVILLELEFQNLLDAIRVAKGKKNSVFVRSSIGDYSFHEVLCEVD